MPVSSLPQFSAMVGASISVDGIAFDDVAHMGPKRVEYTGPTSFTAVSGRPYLQGPARWKCTWDTMVLDDLQALYTCWNIRLNTPAGPRVTFSVNDPRNAGAFQSYQCWMSEPQFSMEELFVRAVSVMFTEVIE